jgi:hypothetical protein
MDDIDDVILNTLGGISGLLLFRLISVSDTAIFIPVTDCNAMGYYEEIHGDTILINKFLRMKDTGSKGEQSIVIAGPGKKHSVFSFCL